MRTSCVLAVVLLTLPLLAIGQSAESVRVSSSHADAAGCTSVGMIHGVVDTFWGQNTASLYAQLRKKAAKMGANLVVLLGGVTTVKGSNGSDLEADGEAFACSDRPPSSAAPGLTAPAQGDAAQSAAPLPNPSNVPCGRNFSSEGLKVKGTNVTTFTTFADFADVDREAAIAKLLARLPQAQLTLVRVDKERGLIVTNSSAPNGRTFTVAFAVAQTPQGVRVSGSVALAKGIASNDDAVRDSLCRIIATVAQPATPGPESTAASVTSSKPAGGEALGKAPITSPTKGSVEERLQQLEQLFEKGLITADEYKKKKEEILKDF
jgi:hypothetical protein